MSVFYRICNTRYVIDVECHTLYLLCGRIVDDVVLPCVPLFILYCIQQHMAKCIAQFWGQDSRCGGIHCTSTVHVVGPRGVFVCVTSVGSEVP